MAKDNHKCHHSCGCGCAEQGHSCSTAEVHQHEHRHEHGHDEDEGVGECHGHSHDHDEGSMRGMLLRILASLLLFGIALVVDKEWLFGLNCLGVLGAWLAPLLYIVAVLPVGLPVLHEAWELFAEERSLFNECSLMVIAVVGAFVIAEYPEAVILMVLYNIGELLQGLAVQRARKDISDMVDVRSETVQRILEDGTLEEVLASDVLVGARLHLRSGERLALDGILLSESALLDQSALTGESVPREVMSGEEVLAGCMVVTRPIEMEVTKPYSDSTLARILKMAEEAADRKPATERFIRRFATIYTPIVVGLAVLVVLLPFVWSLLSPTFDFHFKDWLYRALVFLVTSCPCALIISVPLSYFCGLGAGSNRGLLFKGALYLEQLRKITAVAFDKTGTLTEGTFEVTEVLTEGIDEQKAVLLLAAVESRSTHPMAEAMVAYAQEHAHAFPSLVEVEELTGMGLSAHTEEGMRLLVGSERLMRTYHLEIPTSLLPGEESSILLAVDNKVVAVAILRDKIKPHSADTIRALHKRGVHHLVMLSGDKLEVAQRVGHELGLEAAYGGLLPDAKLSKVEELGEKYHVAFVGDGLNDAPVMGVAHIGVAMGGMGSDATIEAADIVIQGDDPYKLVEAIDISRYTHRIVLQNIIFALGFKLVVMLLATFGIASLTLAVIADVGVTILVVFNALRALRYRGSVRV